MRAAAIIPPPRNTSISFLSALLLFKADIGCSGMAVHPYLFPAKRVVGPAATSSKSAPQSLDSESSSSSSSSSSPIVVFIHGRLEAEPKEDILIPPPRQLYAEFCHGLADRIPLDGGDGAANTRILVPEYHEHYGDWKREPRDLRLGPVSSAVGDVIRDHIIENEAQHNSAEKSKLILMSYSMGAAILLKLLQNDSIILSDEVIIDKLVLIEPVWRCWLPFAVSEASVVSNVPALALVGTNDILTRDDSGGGINGVARSLRPFLPNLSVTNIDGGNHFGICSGIGDLATDCLPSGMAPSDVRGEIIHHVSSFCGWT